MPLVRNRDGALVEASWDQALAVTCAALQPHAGADIAALVSPMTSSEEGMLLARLLHALGSESLDHRLRKTDSADHAMPRIFAMPLAEIERANAIFLIGSDPRREQPLLAHRMRKAALGGARVFVLNAVDFGFNFDLTGRFIVAPHAWGLALAEIAAGRTPAGCADVDVQAMRDAFATATSSVVIIGDQAVQHLDFASLRAAGEALANSFGACCNELPQGANALGLTHVGVRPGRGGRDSTRIVAEGGKAMLLYGCEPEDFAQSACLLRALDAAELVIAFASFANDELLARADIVLPIGLIPEIDATLVNVDGRVQRTSAGGALPGETRAGWRVLRALGAQLGLAGFEFTELSELRAQLPAIAPTPSATSQAGHARESGHNERKPASVEGFSRIANVPIYRTDAVVRRAPALQATALAASAVAALHPVDAAALGLEDGMRVIVAQGEARCELPLKLDARVARGAAWIPAGFTETAALEGIGSQVGIGRARGGTP